MAGFDLLWRLFPLSRDRDGQAAGLVAAAQEGAAAPAGAPALRPPSDPELALQAAVATKLLDGFLANRNQIQMPHTLNFRALEPGEARLLLGVMAAAAQADGRVDANEARQLPQALSRVGAGEEEAAELARLMEEPQPLADLTTRVQEAGLGAHAYAAALLAINRRNRVNRAFLGYLAARLGLAPDVAATLERRYRA